MTTTVRPTFTRILSNWVNILLKIYTYRGRFVVLLCTYVHFILYPASWRHCSVSNFRPRIFWYSERTFLPF